MSGNIYTRQNDKLAVIYRKASDLCYKREKLVKYFVIALSTALCLLSILNRYSAAIFPNFKVLIKSKDTIAETIVLISGLILILQIFVNWFSSRMHIEGVNFEERYDNYVFMLQPNKSLMRPISDTNIENYASKVTLPSEYFTDYYFTEPAKASERNAQFRNYFRIFENKYRLLLNVQGFFQTIWIGFIVLVIALAVSFDDTFLKTISNILIPSLSIFSLIASSWYTFNEQMRYLQNSLNVLKELEHNDTVGEDSPASLSSPFLLRSIQDSLFNMRMNDFDVPVFLVRRYEKKMARLEWGEDFDYINRRFQKKKEKVDKKIEITYSYSPDLTVTRVQKMLARLRRKKNNEHLSLEAEPLRQEEINEIVKPVKKQPSEKVNARAVPAADKPAEAKPAAGKPTANKPAIVNPAANKPAVINPAANKPAVINRQAAAFRPDANSATDTADVKNTGRIASAKAASDKAPVTGAAEKPGVKITEKVSSKPAETKKSNKPPAKPVSDKAPSIKPVSKNQAKMDMPLKEADPIMKKQDEKNNTVK